MKENYDAIIVGAGIGGVICGAYLSAGGLDTLVTNNYDGIVRFEMNEDGLILLVRNGMANVYAPNLDLPEFVINADGSLAGGILLNQGTSSS